MFLAGKVEETPRPLKDVVLISYEIIHKKDPAAVARIKQKVRYFSILLIFSIYPYFPTLVFHKAAKKLSIAGALLLLSNFTRMVTEDCLSCVGSV